jgi:4-hydroxybenzoate polyprenyltransferase
MLEATSRSAHSEGSALCVDLDGTLLDSDLLYESLLALLARNPLYLFLLPLWLLGGKAALKRQIASRVSLDPRHLPYNRQVLEALSTTAQRPRVLCTASDRLLAEPIAAHLGLFEEVLASDGQRNLSGTNKADALVQRFGERGFEYMGNGRVDLAVWARSAGAWVVNAGTGLAGAAAATAPLRAHWPAGSRGRAWPKALRLHQWLKNLLVFLPLLMSHRFLEPVPVLHAGLAFLAFSLCASGVYLLNDLLDLDSDRQHKSKRNRPFAAGRLPLLHGLLAAPALAAAGLALSLACGPRFTAVLLMYYVVTLAYSLKIKRLVMIDVVTLAGLYTTRIIGGAVAIGSALSFWLLAFSMFIFLSLALLKRYTELHALVGSGRGQASGRGYQTEDLPLLQSLGAASGYIAVLVMALYINSPDSIALYRQPKLLWLICPVVLYWISRAWMIAHRGRMHDDPIVFAATDRVSQASVAVCALCLLAAI